MLNNLKFLLLFLISGYAFSSMAFASSPGEQVEKLISQKEAPGGVVFEIVTGTANSLKWALPQTNKLIKKLRKHFPDLEIAVVTHGNEMFALKTSNNKKYKKIHSLTQQLVKDENIPVHVCGTFAGWKDVGEEEFPDYVDVTAAGPATINDYIDLGYYLIKL